jgi:hypothetical protein
MTDVNRLFEQLAHLSDELNRESDALTAKITEFEKRLIDLKLGIALWFHEPIAEHTQQHDNGEVSDTVTHLVFAKGEGGWGLYLRGIVRGDDPDNYFGEMRLRDTTREDRVKAVSFFPQFLEAMVDAARKRVAHVKQGRLQADKVIAG